MKFSLDKDKLLFTSSALAKAFEAALAEFAEEFTSQLRQRSQVKNLADYEITKIFLNKPKTVKYSPEGFLTVAGPAFVEAEDRYGNVEDIWTVPDAQVTIPVGDFFELRSGEVQDVSVLARAGVISEVRATIDGDDIHHIRVN